jgi:hypothetical protein
MTADNYLRKAGALPAYKKSDVLCGLALICEELFAPQMVVEPDCISWTQESPDTPEDNFGIRTDFILYGTSGNVGKLLKVARKASTWLCEQALEELVVIHIHNYANYKYFVLDEEKGTPPWEQPHQTNKWLVQMMNESQGLEGDESFWTWGEVLHIYKSGDLSECGVQAVTRFLASPPKKYSYAGHPEVLRGL